MEIVYTSLNYLFRHSWKWNNLRFIFLTWDHRQSLCTACTSLFGQLLSVNQLCWTWSYPCGKYQCDYVKNLHYLRFITRKINKDISYLNVASVLHRKLYVHKNSKYIIIVKHWLLSSKKLLSKCIMHLIIEELLLKWNFTCR